MSERRNFGLTSELQQMADEAARQARPPAAAEIIRQGDRRRRRSLVRRSLGGLSVAGVVGAGVALGLGTAGSAPVHGTGTIRTDAFTLVSNANGTATLTINGNLLFEPGALQRDLARDGIPAMVTAGSFCSSDPAPVEVWQVVGAKGPRSYPPKLIINPAKMPAGTELSFGNFQLAKGERTFLAVIDTGSYTCSSSASTNGPPGSEILTVNPGFARMIPPWPDRPASGTGAPTH